MLTKQAIYAGKAVFTVHAPDGVHYTFKVSRSDDGRCYFVNLLTGPNNMGDYTYVGLLTDGMELRLTRASKFNDKSRPVVAFRWVLRMIAAGSNATIPEGYGINHAGRCMRCGRPLTHPDGIDERGPRYGFGPECYEKL